MKLCQAVVVVHQILLSLAWGFESVLGEVEAVVGREGNAEEVRQILSKLEYDAESMSERQVDALKHATIGDPIAIRAIAQGLMHERSAFGDMNLPVAAELYHLSSRLGDVPSMVNLGTMFAEGYGVDRSPREALRWFMAASDGGYQGATYNCGLLLAEEDRDAQEDERVAPDVVSAFEYFHLAFSMRNLDSPPAIVNEVTTTAAKQAYETFSDIFAYESWGLDQLSRIFEVGTLYTELNEEVTRKWRDGLTHLRLFNDGFAKGVGVVNEDRRLELQQVLREWGQILELHDEKLSKLQRHLLLDNLQDVVGPLAGKDDAFVIKAGELAEALAVSEYCFEKYAVNEGDSACFNGAVSAAMSYYRRAGRADDATRVFNFAKKHPHASTKWTYQSQTPRVYYRGLRSSPWWDEKQFDIARSLELVYASVGKEAILRELDTIVHGKEGAKVRRGGNIKAENIAEGDPQSDKTKGLERVFTPHIGVRGDTDAVENDGAGVWSEFGPLFDGLDWSESRCSALPTLCKILKEHVHDEMCGLNSEELQMYRKKGVLVEERMRKAVEARCGADTIATVLRLRPGTNILPHCGTTNRRLIMHFAIQGAKDVKFRAGDSEQSSAPGGWVDSYGQGDGHAIIFDDSFEHEVRHDGMRDRYVLLVVLKHPDDAPRVENER